MLGLNLQTCLHYQSVMKEISHSPMQRSPDGGSKPGHGWGVGAAILGQAWCGVRVSQIPRLGDEGGEEVAENTHSCHTANVNCQFDRIWTYPRAEARP